MEYAKSPKEARALGLSRYFTGKSCPKGHVAERMLSSRGCVECNQVKDRTDENRIMQNRARAMRNYELKADDPNYKAYAVRKATEWNNNNLDRRREISRESARRNRARQYAYDKERKQTDPQYKIATTLRRRLGDALRAYLNGGERVGSAVRDLGCTLEEFKEYIEKQFQSGMSWENWGLYTWHLDHVVPLSQFDLTDREQFLKAFHYTNYQPLWAAENLMKNWRRPATT